MPCPECLRGWLIFVRWWLQREIRQCDICGARFTVDPRYEGEE